MAAVRFEKTSEGYRGTEETENVEPGNKSIKREQAKQFRFPLFPLCLCVSTSWFSADRSNLRALNDDG
ncbi:MAG: hypothetical protein JWP89_7082 [Schlesneria sp.]|nr:hypothetical protein [Schlesneria sp.]